MLAQLAEASVRSLLLAVFAAVILLVLSRRGSAALQHAAWTAVVCGMLALLGDRFHLAAHRSSVEQPVLAMVVEKSGLKLKEAQAGPTSEDADAAFRGDCAACRRRNTRQARAEREWRVYDDASQFPDRRRKGDGQGRRRSPVGCAKHFAPGLADLLGHWAPGVNNIVDITGMKGRYEVHREVSNKDLMGFMPPSTADSAAKESGEIALASGGVRVLNTALQKLGLQIERRRGPVEIVAADHLEKNPTAN